MRKTLALILALLAALMLVLPAAAEEENLLVNGGFEQSDTGYTGWYTEQWVNKSEYTIYSMAHPGLGSDNCVMIENVGANDARYAQTVKVERNTVYRLSGDIYVESMEDAGKGANISVEGVYVFSECFFDADGEWHHAEIYVKTAPEQTELTVFARVGGYSGESVGKAFFDNIELVKVDSVPSGVYVEDLKTQTPSENTTTATTEGEPDSRYPQSLLVCFLLILLTILCLYFFYDKKQELHNKAAVALTLAAGLIVALAARMVISGLVLGYDVDVVDFQYWADRMFSEGPWGFYAEGAFCDYPPAYLYMLWLTAAVQRVLGLNGSLVILKFIPSLCDVIGALLLYKIAKKRETGDKAAVALAFLYAFNPLSALNGAAWGQVDSVLALLLLLVVDYAMDKNWKLALPLFFVAALVKPQALMLAPVGLIAIVISLIFTGDNKEEKAQERRSAVLGALYSIAAMLVILLPFFIGGFSPAWLYNLYKDTLSSYPHTTVNTTNLYYLISPNWGDLEAIHSKRITSAVGAVIIAMSVLGAFFSKKRGEKKLIWLMGALATAGLVFAVLPFIIKFNYTVFGTYLSVLVFAYVLGLLALTKRLDLLPLFCAVAYIGMYVLGIKMHERYLFPAILLLYLAFADKKDARIIVLMIGLSITTYMNTALVLDNSLRLGRAGGHLSSNEKWLNDALSYMNVALCLYSFALLFASALPKYKQLEPKSALEKGESPHRENVLERGGERLNLRRKDYILIFGVTLVYSVLAFCNLGSTKAPQREWVSSQTDEQIVFDLGSQTEAYMLYYGFISYDDFMVAVSEDGESWEEYPAYMREGECFHWRYLSEGTYGGSYSTERIVLKGRYVKLIAMDMGLTLGEVIFRDMEGSTISVTVNEELSIIGKNDPALLTDEQDSLEGEPSWYNGTYFDEVYHARTGYEHLHGIRPYETTHPPLGKLMMSACIAIFGMTPFGWRFAGALVGVLMLPVMYILGVQLTGKRKYAFLAMLLLALDGMHFAQTRIATIDSFPVFFIMTSYMFMIRYIKMNVYEHKLSKTLIPLALSGLFIGFAIASKWIGIYAGVGLAVMFFYALFRQWRMSCAAREMLKEKEHKDDPILREAAESFAQRALITCAFCCLFFILVPLGIYMLCYIPYLAPSGGFTPERWWNTQTGMFRYHSKKGLGDDHPFSSPWWQWPFILKPMWYCQDAYEPAGYARTLFSFGNPAVWWTGAISMVVVMLMFAWRHTAERLKKPLRILGICASAPALALMVSGLALGISSDLYYRSEAGWTAFYISAGVLGAVLLAMLMLTIIGMRLHPKKRDMSFFIILISFAAQFMPWIIVPRSTYIYHYFASVPFIILATVLLLKYIGERFPKTELALRSALITFAVVCFIGFYPYYSGATTPEWWLKAMKWFHNWLYY